jgi:hypothetical protein
LNADAFVVVYMTKFVVVVGAAAAAVDGDVIVVVGIDAIVGSLVFVGEGEAFVLLVLTRIAYKSLEHAERDIDMMAFCFAHY